MIAISEQLTAQVEKMVDDQVQIEWISTSPIFLESSILLDDISVTMRFLVISRHFGD